MRVYLLSGGNLFPKNPSESEHAVPKELMSYHPELPLQATYERWFRAIDQFLQEPSTAAMNRKDASAYLEEKRDHFRIKGDEKEQETMRDYLIDILETEPGARLLKEIVKRGGKLSLEFTTTCGTVFRYFKDSRNKGRVLVNSSFDTYLDGVTRDGVPVVFVDDVRVGIFHEVHHFYQRLSKNSRLKESAKTRNSNPVLIDPDFGSGKEQDTIAGESTEGEQQSMLSENCFRIALLGKDAPIRINHRGINGPCGKPPELLEFAFLRCGTSYFKAMAESDPELLNREFPLLLDDGSIYQLRPLSAAIVSGSHELENYMLDPGVGVDMNYVDDRGTPLQLAIEYYDSDLAVKILQRGLDLAKSVPLMQWKRFLESSGKGPFVQSPDSESLAQTARGEHVSHPNENKPSGAPPVDPTILYPYFEKLRESAEEIVKYLLHFDTEEGVIDMVSVMRCALAISEIKAHASTVFEERHGGDLPKEEYMLIKYLKDVPSDAFIEHFLRSFLNAMDVESRARLFEQVEELNFYHVVKRSLLQLAEAAIEAKGQIGILPPADLESLTEEERAYYANISGDLIDESEVVSDITMLVDVENPEFRVDEAMEKGKEHFANFLMQRFEAVVVLKHFKDAILQLKEKN